MGKLYGDGMGVKLWDGMGIGKNPQKQDMGTGKIHEYGVGWGQSMLLCHSLTWSFNSMEAHLYTHHEPKKQDTVLVPITSPNVDKYSKFFPQQTHK